MPSVCQHCRSRPTRVRGGAHLEGPLDLAFHLELGNLACPPPRRVDLSGLGSGERLSPVGVDNLVPFDRVEVLSERGLGAFEPGEAFRAALCPDEQAQLGFEGRDEECAQVAGRDVFEGLVRREDGEVGDERGAEGQVG